MFNIWRWCSLPLTKFKTSKSKPISQPPSSSPSSYQPPDTVDYMCFLNVSSSSKDSLSSQVNNNVLMDVFNVPFLESIMVFSNWKEDSLHPPSRYRTNMELYPNDILVLLVECRCDETPVGERYVLYTFSMSYSCVSTTDDDPKSSQTPVTFHGKRYTGHVFVSTYKHHVFVRPTLFKSPLCHRSSLSPPLVDWVRTNQLVLNPTSCSPSTHTVDTCISLGKRMWLWHPPEHTHLANFVPHMS